MTRSSPLLPAAGGVLAAAALMTVSHAPVRLAPGGPGWTRLVGNAGPSGVVPQAALVRLPGLDRRAPGLLTVSAEAPGGAAATLGVAVDGGPVQWVRASAAAPASVLLPAARAPGARVTLRRADGAPPLRLGTLTVHREREPPLPWLAAALAFAAAAGVTGALRTRLGASAALALGLFTGAAVALSFAPALLWMTLPAPASLLRAALPVALLAAAAVLAARQPDAQRRAVCFGAGVIAAFVFGAWVRAWFLPSAGSWDTEYWKGWTARMGRVGVLDVYGEAQPFTWDRFRDWLRGREPLPTLERGLTIDYPPFTMMALRVLSAAASPARAALDGAEIQNVVVKMLPVLGDVAAVLFLLIAFRRAPRRALGLAALYWALPSSWLSSAVLGFLDGASAPFAAAALWMAGRGRAGRAGALLAVAALLKSTALLVAPAAAVALWAARAPVRRAVLAGLAVVAVGLAPFVVAGTAPVAVAQVFRILFQKTLSGGFANPWWLAGHGVSMAGGSAWTSPVQFVPQSALGWAVGPVALALFALSVLVVVRAQRHMPGPRAAALAGAGLVFAYGLLALGVHENHPHATILLLLASGVATPVARLLFAGIATSYTMNLLAFSGLGRFYGPRHLLLDPLAGLGAAVRLALGFDLTLVLALANMALFGCFLLRLSEEMRRAEAVGSGYDLAA